SGSGPITNNSANTETLSLVLADSGGGLSKYGAGALVLDASDSYSGNTFVYGGKLAISPKRGVNNSSILWLRPAFGNTLLVNGGSLSQQVFLIGNTNGSVAAFYQTNGSASAAAATSFDNTSVGNTAGSIGYLSVAAGSSFTSDGMAVGGENNNGTGFS